MPSSLSALTRRKAGRSRLARVFREGTRALLGEMPVMQAVQAFVRDEGGATAIEYALIASLISVFCITVFQTVGGKASNTFNAIANTLH